MDISKRQIFRKVNEKKACVYVYNCGKYVCVSVCAKIARCFGIHRNISEMQSKCINNKWFLETHTFKSICGAKALHIIASRPGCAADCELFFIAYDPGLDAIQRLNCINHCIYKWRKYKFCVVLGCWWMLLILQFETLSSSSQWLGE